MYVYLILQSHMKTNSDQFNGSSLCNKIKSAFLAHGWNNPILDASIIIRELAIQVAKISEMEAFLVVPQNHCTEREKNEAKSHGINIMEAMEQPGFEDPLDWLNFFSEDIGLDIVVGVGERLGKIAQVLKKRHQCKSIFVASDFDVQHQEFQGLLEEIATFKDRELRHKRNVGLCQMADLPVGIGPKMTDRLTVSLCFDKKSVYPLIPGVISEFREISDENRARGYVSRKFRVLVLDANSQEGLDIAAKAVAELDDESYHLYYATSAAKGEHGQLAKKFYQHGIAKSQLTICTLPKRAEGLKRLFCEVDLAIMPSSEQGFEMVALAALSSALPILVHEHSGFGEALSPVKSSQSSIVDSEDAKFWAKAIKKIRRTERKTRLAQAASLRSHYDEKYSWEKQFEPLIQQMMSMASGMNTYMYLSFKLYVKMSIQPKGYLYSV